MLNVIGGPHALPIISARQSRHTDSVFLPAGVSARILLPAGRPRGLAALVRLVLGGAGGLRGRALGCIRSPERRPGSAGADLAVRIRRSIHDRADLPCTASWAESLASVAHRFGLGGYRGGRHPVRGRSALSARLGAGRPRSQRSHLCPLWRHQPYGGGSLYPPWPATSAGWFYGDRRSLGPVWHFESGPRRRVVQHGDLGALRS